MAVRTKLLASGRLTGVVTTTIYTVPEGETAIIKLIRLFNLNSGTATDVVVLMDAGAFDKTSYERLTLSPLKGEYIERWQVLMPGMELALNIVAAVGVNYWVSGTELEGTAD